MDYVNGTWTETTIDANNAPALGTTIAASIPLTTADKNQYILIDITPAVQAWLSGIPNDGIALVGNSPANASFDSKETTTTSHPAELDLVFAMGSSGGGITGISTASGSGLIGGGDSGTLNLSLINTCSSKQILQWSGSAWACASPGTGTITGVTAGTDLTGGGSSGSVTLNVDTTKVPQLAAANTFTGTQTINNDVSITAPSAPLTVNSASGIGVQSFGEAGIYGQDNVAGGFGVIGLDAQGNGYGVYGSGYSGVYGISSGYLSGVWGDVGGTAGDSIAVVGTAGENGAAYFINNGSNYVTMWAENDAESLFNADIFVAYGGYFGGDCWINVSGGLYCIQGSDVVSVDNGARKLALYSTQSPENWFEDFGSGSLSSGAITVILDPTFAQTVNTGIEYHVFLTPKGDCKGLYVANENARGFDVRELGGGTSNVAFAYRIVAKRLGYENVRLADMTEQQNKLDAQHKKMQSRMHSAAPPVAVPKPPVLLMPPALPKPMLPTHAAMTPVAAQQK